QTNLFGHPTVDRVHDLTMSGAYMFHDGAALKKWLVNNVQKKLTSSKDTMCKYGSLGSTKRRRVPEYDVEREFTGADLLNPGVVDLQQVIQPCEQFCSALRHDE